MAHFLEARSPLLGSALTPAQIRHWEAKLDEWDSLFSFLVEELAGENADAAMRNDLLARSLGGIRRRSKRIGCALRDHWAGAIPVLLE